MIFLDAKDWKAGLEKHKAVVRAVEGGGIAYYADNGDGEEIRQIHTKYVPAEDFVQIARSRSDKQELINHEGSARWLFTREDGSQYILRPLENE